MVPGFIPGRHRSQSVPARCIAIKGLMVGPSPRSGPPRRSPRRGIGARRGEGTYAAGAHVDHRRGRAPGPRVHEAADLTVAQLGLEVGQGMLAAPEVALETRVPGGPEAREAVGRRGLDVVHLPQARDAPVHAPVEATLEAALGRVVVVLPLAAVVVRVLHG
jgi:hypothetical protein